MFGIGVSELILIAIVALIVVGPKNLPVTLRAIGRAIGEFRRATRELRREVGYDEVVDEVTRPLREGMAGLEADVLRAGEDPLHGSGAEYPEGGPDDYGALPEGAGVYPDLAPVYTPEQARALEAGGPRRPVEGTVARGRGHEEEV
jgi:Tat protein translocase TatB subunit